MRNLLSIVLLICYSSVLYGQDKWLEIDSKEYLSAIIKLEQAIPQSENYLLRTNTLVFSDYESMFPIQKLEMELKCENGHLFNILSNGLMIIQDKGINITIDTLGREIYLQAEDSKFNYRKQSEDYTVLAEMAKRIYKSNQGDLTTYYLELIPGYEITGIELTVDKQWFKKMVYYSSSSVDRINYPDQLSRFELSVESFLTGKKAFGGKMITPNEVVNIDVESITLKPLYKDFKLIDLR